MLVKLFVTMDVKKMSEYFFERYGVSNIDEIRHQLYDDLKSACFNMCETLETNLCFDVNDFARIIFTETKLDQQFWLNSKINFFGTDEIINWINIKSKKLNIFDLSFLREKYWTVDSQLQLKSRNIEVTNEVMRRGMLGEASLMQYLNEAHESHFFTSSGRLILRSIPCIGATPDYLVLDRKDVVERLPKMYDHVKKASGIAEVKTTLTPENFCADENFTSANLEQLLQAAIKYRHIFVSSRIPDVYNVNKKTGFPKVNWLSNHLLKQLLDLYTDTCKINVIDFDRNKTYSFSFRELEKKVYVNFLTSNRGKQLLGQCLVFYDSNRHFTTIDIRVFYLYMKRENDTEKDYCIEIRCSIPVDILKHFEVELNKEIYGEYLSKCILV